MSLVCEEFGCLPSQAIEELENTPYGLVGDIMELRAYAKAKQAVGNARNENEMPTGKIVDLVLDIEAEIAKEQKGG